VTRSAALHRDSGMIRVMLRRLVSLFVGSALLSVAACGGAAAPQPRPTAEAAPTSAVGGPVRLIQETRRASLGKQALSIGVLTVDEQGCLRLNGSGPTLIWPAEAALDLTEPGAVKVFDRSDGSSVRVGERVALGGGSFPAGPLPALNQPLGACAGDVWDVDSFETAAAFEERYPHMRGGPRVPPAPPPPTGARPVSRDPGAGYASTYGISPEEARARLSRQAEIGAMGHRLQSSEPDTFAGFWIEHAPRFRAVAAFTRDPEATLRRHTADPLYEARLLPVPYRELRATQQRLYRFADELGLAMSAGLDVKANQVTLEVEDAARFRAEAARRGVSVPPYVRLEEPRPLLPAPRSR